MPFSWARDPSGGICAIIRVREHGARNLQEASFISQRPNPQPLEPCFCKHYALHADSQRYLKDRRVWQKTIDRDVSLLLLLYLNEDHTGGALSFYAFNYAFKPWMGDLLFFPSGHRYAHQAHEVKSGRR